MPYYIFFPPRRIFISDILQISRKNIIIILQVSIRTCLYCMKAHLIWVFSAQFHPTKNVMNQSLFYKIDYEWTNPCSIIFIIKGAIEHSCLENHSAWKYKICHRIPVTFLVQNKIIFQLSYYYYYFLAQSKEALILYFIHKNQSVIYYHLHAGHVTLLVCKM